MHDILIMIDPVDLRLSLSCQRCGWVRDIASPKSIGYLLSEATGHDCPAPGQLELPFGVG